MLNAITSINKRVVVKKSGIQCLPLIFNLNNLRMTILLLIPARKKLVQGCNVQKVIYCFFAYGLR